MRNLVLIGFLFLAQTAHAQLAETGDIDTYNTDYEKAGPDFIRADDVTRSPIRTEGLSMSLFIRKNGELLPLRPFNVTLTSGGESFDLLTDGSAIGVEGCSAEKNVKFRGSFDLKNKYFEIKKNKVYEFLFDLNCGESTRFIFDHDSFAGEAIGIFDIANTAIKKFQALGLEDFWRKSITIRWPGSGDYYSWGTVNVTKGYQWDVVGHELGHAIYDQADIGSFGGGSHRIDECYTDALALSEGWASFFAAWLKVQLSDEDAKFEYLVPRRAPIRFENIPVDVCKGPRNEWRVTGFLWDIIDHHDDLNDQSRMSFSNFWNKTINKKFGSAKELADYLEVDGFDPVLLNVVWEQNFLSKR